MTEEKNTTLEWRTLYMFNKRGGKLVKCIEGRGRGMLMMWALQNTRIIFLLPSKKFWNINS